MVPGVQDEMPPVLRIDDENALGFPAARVHPLDLVEGERLAVRERAAHLLVVPFQRAALVAQDAKRDDIISEISRHEVAVNVHFVPLPMLSYFRSKGYDIKDYPTAYNNYSHEISLPVYPQLDDEKVRFVAKTLIEAYQTVIER